MKAKIIYRCSLFVFALLGISLPALYGKTITARSIMEMCDMAEGYRSNYSEAKQIITTTSGAKRTLVTQTWALNDGQKQLAHYTAPADIKGQKILMTAYGDNIWMYNAETRRTRKLGSHMKKKKMMGTDFSYEDQSGGRLVIKYNGEHLGKETLSGVECHKLKMIPTSRGPSYGKIIAWIGAQDYISRRVDYYRKGESTPFKRLILSDIRAVGAKKVPFVMVMTNLEDRTSTKVVLLKTKFGVKIPPRVFQPSQLGR